MNRYRYTVEFSAEDDESAAELVRLIDEQIPTSTESVTSLKRVSTEETNLFIVRHYDGFDNTWMDVTKPVTKAEADDLWSNLTEYGTKWTRYEDIDYYKIFPADTKMLHS